MYFALDVCDPSRIYAEISNHIHARPDLHWLALIDGAFDYGSKVTSLESEKVVIYNFDGMRAMLPASPYLITLAIGDVDQLRTQIFALAKQRRNRPMLSFIATKYSPNDVWESFKPFINVTTEDGQEFILRFADTRILSVLPTCLENDKWAGLTRLITQWLIIDRDGLLTEMGMAEEKAHGKSSVLSDAELDRLLEKGETDAIINVLSKDHFELLRDIKPADLFVSISALSLFCRKYEIIQFPDKVALAVYFLISRKSLDADAKLLSLLTRNGWVAGKLIDDLIQLVDD